MTDSEDAAEAGLPHRVKTWGQRAIERAKALGARLEGVHAQAAALGRCANAASSRFLPI